ncbi:MAG: adenylate/guanylate cyclase domain-containing protein [SAR324 cluster bacterium]|nr:adenylate/guanylate cyclase domain-containing protein [SAR324 cluster bacterium]
MEKRKSTILMADVVGYSRLVAQDIETTLHTLQNYRKVFSHHVTEHAGWIVNTPGDSILAEFKEPVDAVRSAAKIQNDLAKQNAELPGEEKMFFRIGISQGEVLAEENGIYGNEVNIAARLEGLAIPGGICISSIVHSNISGTYHIECEYLGEHELKNISRPVPVYRVLFDAPREPGGEGKPATPQAGNATLSEVSNPATARLSKPSIAVLPFTNFSNDQEQEYFADGMTEDIITELSRSKSLLVIARNSTFTYKGQAVTVQQVGKDLGVEYVLEGSVRKDGNRVRITAQLVDAIDGTHLWAERFDRELKDVFSLQDEMAQMIVANIPRRVEAANLERANTKVTESVAAYDLLLRGKDHHHKRTREDNAKALEMLDKAIALDPDFAQAHAWKACTLGQASARGYRAWSEELARESVELAEKARELDEGDSESHRILCELHIYEQQFDQAESSHERAFSLNPNDPRIVAQRGQLLTWLGKPEEGVGWIELARRLDPYPPDGRADSLGQALFSARRYAEAVNAYKLIGSPRYSHHANMAACYAMMDEPEPAAKHAATALKLNQEISIQGLVKDLPYKQDTDREHHMQALQKAGLPE